MRAPELTQASGDDGDVARSQPHALGPEKSILSSMLACPEEHIELALSTGLTEEAFYLPAHSKLFAHIVSLHRSRKPIELVSLVQGLMDSGELDHIGGPAAVTDIFTYSPGHGHFRHHLKLVMDKHILRSLVKVCTETIAEAYSEPGDAELLVDKAERDIASIREYTEKQVEEKSTKELLLESFEGFQARLEGRSSPMGISTGIREIDTALMGMRGKRVWVIGAYPSGGKSLIGGQMVMSAALAGDPAAVVSLELPEKDIMDRMVIQQSRQHSLAYTDPERFKRENGGEITVHMLNRLKIAAREIRDAPLFVRRIHGAHGSKIESVVTAIRRLHKAHGLKVVAIDHLQRITAKRQSGDSKEQEVQIISHAFQHLADELDLQILILSQLNLDGDTKHGRVIEEDADAFLLVKQDMNKESKTFKQHQGIRIVKDRHCGNGGLTLPVLMNRENLRFEFGEVPREEPATRFSR